MPEKRSKRACYRWYKSRLPGSVKAEKWRKHTIG
jgi:hypothetical protein